MANKCKKNQQVTCPDPVSINCITWDGEDLPCFEICNGDSLQPFVYNIATYVCQILEDIDVTQVTLCGDYISLLGSQDKTIANLFQILLDKGCSLNTLVLELQEQINEGVPLDIDFKCLETDIDPCNPVDLNNLSIVLQIIIDNFCNIKQEFENIQNTINETIETEIGDFLENLIVSPQTNRVFKSGTGSSLVYTLRGFVPPNTALPYFGSMSYFDATGKGSGIMDGWYICNGNNGTKDMRGFTPVGAVSGVPGGALDPIVDPTLPQNILTPTSNYVVGSKGGKITNYLSLNQIPDHQHNYTLNDPGHHHLMFYLNDNSGSTTFGTYAVVVGNDSDGNKRYVIKGGETPANFYQTETKSTGISITMGGVQGFTAVNYIDNRMPYQAVVWIQMIN